MADRNETLLEIWKTIVGVQMHFNQLEMQIRNFAVTILAAFLAAAGYSMKEAIQLRIFGYDTSLTALILLSGSIVWLCFYGMDRFWYHRLLRGSVNQGLIVETVLATEFPEIQLTKAIGDASPIHLGKFRIRSDLKMDIFYLLITSMLLLGAYVSLNAGTKAGVSIGKVGPSSIQPTPTKSQSPKTPST